MILILTPTDAVFKRQLAAALAYSKDADNIQTLIVHGGQICGQTTRLVCMVLPIPSTSSNSETAWSWAVKLAWIKAALGGDGALIA